MNQDNVDFAQSQQQPRHCGETLVGQGAGCPLCSQRKQDAKFASTLQGQAPGTSYAGFSKGVKLELVSQDTVALEAARQREYIQNLVEWMEEARPSRARALDSVKPLAKKI